jgi:intraflagellar transport protein 56
MPQVLPGLGDMPSEARLNLVIHYLRAGKVDEAQALVADINPITPHEYILKVSRFASRVLSITRDRV